MDAKAIWKTYKTHKAARQLAESWNTREATWGLPTAQITKTELGFTVWIPSHTAVLDRLGS